MSPRVLASRLSAHPVLSLVVMAALFAVVSLAFVRRAAATPRAGLVMGAIEPESTSDGLVVPAVDGGVVQAPLPESVADSAVVAASADTVLAAPARNVWDDLADCESGDWDANGDPITGSARWDYGLTFSHGDIFEGGPNFHPGTWDAFRDADMPDHAGLATRDQQVVVAERVLDEQGWGAWPVCSRMLGLR